MCLVRLESVVLALAISIVSSDAVLAQQAPAAWAGWARCQINVQGPGYTDQQTHTWTITGGAPTVEGAFRIYPGTWSVVGGGSLTSTQGNQTRDAQWATTVQNMSAPIAVFVRASDGRMFIQARHPQVRAPRSVNGYQQLTIDGKQQTPAPIAAEAFEWTFPVVEASRPNPNANLIANGSSSPPVTGSVGFMQQAGSQVTVSCTWQFAGPGAAAPQPPPALTAQAIPTPPAPGGGATPAPASGATVPVAPNAPAIPTSAARPTSTIVTTPATPPATPAPAGGAVLAPLAPTNSTLAATCTLRGPDRGTTPGYGSPGSAYLYWTPVAGATGYTVSRSDLGVLTPTPLSATTGSFTHRALLYPPKTYIYTIFAIYPQGCGSRDLTITSQAPQLPSVFSMTGAAPGQVTLSFSLSSFQQRDYTGVLIQGPALPQTGREVRRYAGSSQGSTSITGVPAGTQTWVVTAFWDTPGGRAIDTSKGRSITVTVP